MEFTKEYPKPKFRLVNAKSCTSQKVWRPKTLDEYCWLVCYEAERFTPLLNTDRELYPNNKKVDELSSNSVLSFTYARNLISDFRNESDSKEYYKYLSFGIRVDNKQINCEIDNVWLLHCMYLRLYWKRAKLLSPEDTEERNQFHSETGWPKNPNSEAFYQVGWSTLEAMNRFTTDVYDAIDTAHSYATMIDANDDAPPQKPLVFSPRLSTPAKVMKDTLRDIFLKLVPESTWPQILFQKEVDRILSNIDYEYEQVMSIFCADTKREKFNPNTYLLNLARLLRDADYLIRKEDTDEDTVLYGYSKEAVKAVHEAVAYEDQIHINIEDIIGKEEADKFQSDFREALQFSNFEYIEVDTGRTSYRPDDTKTSMVASDKGESLAKYIELIVASSAKQDKLVDKLEKVGQEEGVSLSDGIHMKPLREIGGTPEATHSADFSSVYWYGETYTFTPTQKAAIRLLWEAKDNRTPDLGQDYILDEIGSDSKRLRDVFKSHPAWKKMITTIKSGSFRLAKPEKK